MSVWLMLSFAQLKWVPFFPLGDDQFSLGFRLLILCWALASVGFSIRITFAALKELEEKK